MQTATQTHFSGDVWLRFWVKEDRGESNLNLNFKFKFKFEFEFKLNWWFGLLCRHVVPKNLFTWRLITSKLKIQIQMLKMGIIEICQKGEIPKFGSLSKVI